MQHKLDNQSLVRQLPPCAPHRTAYHLFRNPDVNGHVYLNIIHVIIFSQTLTPEFKMLLRSSILSRKRFELATYSP